MNKAAIIRLQTLDQLEARLRDSPRPNDDNLNKKLGELVEIHEGIMTLEEGGDKLTEEAQEMLEKSKKQTYQNWNQLISIYGKFLDHIENPGEEDDDYEEAS